MSPRKSKGKPGLCSRHSRHKTPVFKGYGPDMDNNSGQPSSRNFYTINRLDIVLLPKYQRNSVSLAWLMVHITVIPCLSHLLGDFAMMSLSMPEIWFLCFTKKETCIPKAFLEAPLIPILYIFFVVKLVN